MPVLETIERYVQTVERVSIDASPLLFCTSADPFEIDHDCADPRGHNFIADCSDVVCTSCGRIAWA